MAHVTHGMLDAIVMFEDGADLKPTHPTTSFLDFLRLERAQAAYEHTEKPTTQSGSVCFVDVMISKTYFQIKFISCARVYRKVPKNSSQTIAEVMLVI